MGEVQDKTFGELGFLAQSDPRWQLVERILKTEPFQRSKRHQVLLQYMVDRGLAGKPEDLSERQIGHAVFGKGEDYTTFDDSTVRVQVRQLRFKLHEYFSEEGKHESLILEIPKGSYVPVFRCAETAAEESHNAASQGDSLPQPPAIYEQASAVAPWRIATIVLAIVSLVLLCAIGFGLYRERASAIADDAWSQPVPWPLNCVLSPSKRVRIVVADANYGMFRAASGTTYTLAQYLENSKGLQFPFEQLGPQGKGLAAYLSSSNLTSLADVLVATDFASIAAQHHISVSIRSQRDLQPRDFDQENHILLGGPSSNLWDTLFLDELNFPLVDNLGHSTDGQFHFDNRSPRPGEEKQYSSPGTGSEGDEYADIAMLPATQEHGRVLILQGLHQEGTEAAGHFLTSANEALLKRALGWSGTACPAGFEVLIRTRVVQGDPQAPRIIATRLFR